jgi:2-succinyl-5-enolpyruvyl-6-hydroxy-3-cyclohexene-1-carboxylate synthase
LTVALARSPEIPHHVVLDERAAGFAAVGAAKATGLPSVLVCTSGTAGANYAPAVWEASLSQTPLLILTADRPPELQHCGAPQTMPQVNLFGDAVRAQYSTPVPQARESERVFRSLAARAWHAAVTLRGPVHLNLPFREPLLPTEDCRRPDARPLRIAVPAPVLSADAEEDLTAKLRAAQRILVVCGPMAQPEPALLGWANSWNAPLLADIASGLRFGGHAAKTISAYHGILQAWPESIAAPHVVLRFGGLPTSKALQRWLAASGAYQVVIGEGEWSDPDHLADEVFPVPPDVFIDAVGEGPQDKRAYWETWRQADEAMRGAQQTLLSRQNRSEARLGNQLLQMLEDGDLLFLSNSMPIRDADMFCPPCEKDVRVLVNRGVNGIDGILSTAAGAAAALGRRLVLVIGDLAFQHDMGGLAVLTELGLRARIIVVNNSGGAIFSHLPVRRHTDVFERYFTTPQQFSVAAAAQAFGLAYRFADSNEALATAAREAGDPCIVEFSVDREANVAEHEALWRQLAEAQSL